MVKLFGKKKQRQAIEAFVCAEVSDWLTEVMAATEEGAVVLFPPDPTTLAEIVHVDALIAAAAEPVAAPSARPMPAVVPSVAVA